MKIHTCFRDARLMREVIEKQTEVAVDFQSIAKKEPVKIEVISDEPTAIAEPNPEADKEEVMESACKARSKKKAQSF